MASRAKEDSRDHHHCRPSSSSSRRLVLLLGTATLLLQSTLVHAAAATATTSHVEGSPATAASVDMKETIQAIEPQHFSPQQQQKEGRTKGNEAQMLKEGKTKDSNNNNRSRDQKDQRSKKNQGSSEKSRKKDIKLDNNNNNNNNNNDDGNTSSNGDRSDMDAYLKDVWKGIVHLGNDPNIKAGISALSASLQSASRYAHQQLEQQHHRTRRNLAGSSKDDSNLIRASTTTADMGARGLRKRQEPLIVVQGQLDTNEHATNDHIHKKAHHHHKDMEAAVVKDHEIGDNKVVVEDHPHATLKNKVHEKHHKQDMADDELVSPEHQDDKVDPDTHDLEEEQDQKVEKKKKKKEEKAEDKEIAKDEPRDEVLIGDNVSDNEIMDDIEPLVVEKVGKHKHGHGHKVNDEQEVRNNKNHHTKELDQDDQTEVDRIQDVLQDIFNRNNNNNNNDDHAPELEQQNGEQIVEVQRKKKKKPMHKEEAQDQRQLGLGNDDRHIKKASRNRQASQPVQADAVPNAPPTAATPVVPQTPPGPPQAPQNNQNQNPSTQPQGPQQGVVPQTPPPSGGQPERAKPGSQPGSETKAGAPGAPGGYGTVPMFGPAQLDLGSGASSLANIGSSLSLAVALVVVMMTAM